jgi:hypothetical protein
MARFEGTYCAQETKNKQTEKTFITIKKTTKKRHKETDLDFDAHSVLERELQVKGVFWFPLSTFCRNPKRHPGILGGQNILPVL